MNQVSCTGDPHLSVAATARLGRLTGHPAGRGGDRWQGKWLDPSNLGEVGNGFSCEQDWLIP